MATEPSVGVTGQNGLTTTVPPNALNAARMATFDRFPASPVAEAWVQTVLSDTLAYEAEHHPRDRARKKKDHSSFAEACGAFAFDLVRHSGNEASQGFMYRPFDRVELSFTLVSDTHFGQLINLWLEMGWLEMTGHIHALEEYEGKTLDFGHTRTRRYRATQVFLDRAQKCGMNSSTISNSFQRSQRHADLVQFRTKKGNAYGLGSKGKRVRLKGPEVDKLRGQIERLNTFMQSHEYSLTDAPSVRRLFNCCDRAGYNHDLGGRFYCMSDDDWINKPKDDRKCILIDGQPTVEIDVRASHLSILYALCGEHLDLTLDPYAVGNYPREVVKQLIVTAIGRGGIPKRWPRGFNEEYEEKHGFQPRDRYRLKDVIAMILSRHPVLEKLDEDKLDWANLQFEEAECFLSAMLELHEEHGITSLPVHDSLIVRRQDTASVSEVLAKSYEQRLGFRPSIPLPQGFLG